MRIAVPVAGGEVCAALAACTALMLYEDDHGKVTRRSCAPVQAGEAPLSAVARHGVDVLLCRPLTAAERQMIAREGLLLAETESQDADSAVRAYLNAAIACDPSNDCDYCGFKNECGLPRA